MANTAEVLTQCKSALVRHYGDTFSGVVLFGSLAHGQADDASDIDLLVLLRRPFDYLSELREIIEVLYPIQLQSEQLISAKPAPFDDFQAGSIQLYRNAKKEGVML